jgi:type IV pilus assembly protein PilE
MKRQNGFTLIELMIAVVVVGVLAKIAIPSYTAYMAKAARAQAKGMMLDVSQREERYYTNNGTYVTVAGPVATPANFPNYSGSSMSARKYDITVAAGTIADNTQTIGTSFVITGTPSNGFSDSTCGVLKLDSTGAKTSSGTDSTQCW